ncbi:general stress protein [Enterococcus sp. DIV0876]|uniref:general stress protein n=1 Tax=Enterococcus sp. DIV0876 TaxID=2774633 RepID=UPI003D300DB3
MTNRNLTIIGSYDTRTEALPVIEQLTNEGYGKDDIVLYANKAVIDQFDLDTMTDVDVETTTADDNDHSLWEKIKDAFSFGDHDFENEEDPLFGYRSDIEQNKLVVGVYDYRPMNKVTDHEATSTIDSPLPGETAFPDASVDPTQRLGDSDIEAPINDPNHLRNL